MSLIFTSTLTLALTHPDPDSNQVPSGDHQRRGSSGVSLVAGVAAAVAAALDGSSAITTLAFRWQHGAGVAHSPLSDHLGAAAAAERSAAAEKIAADEAVVETAGIELHGGLDLKKAQASLVYTTQLRAPRVAS